MSATMIAPAAVAAAVALTLIPRRDVMRSARQRLEPPRPRRLRRLGPRRLSIAAVVVAVLLAMAIVGPLGAGVVVTATAVRRRVGAIRARRRRAAAIAAAYPELVDLLVLTIGAGCSPRQAFAVLPNVVPAVLRQGVESVAHGTASGERFADAIIRLRDTPPIGFGSIAQPLADALALADRHGTPLPPILDRLAAEAREHRRRQSEIAARQLPIRLAFPLVGCTLPSFVLLTIVPLMAGTFSSLRGFSP